MQNERFTPDRWLQPDPTLSVFSKLDLATGTVEPMTAEDWFVVWRDAAVDSPVPTGIVHRVEQARACLAYGFFYYPLYALGVEQLLRVAEAALAVRSAELNARAPFGRSRSASIGSRGAASFRTSTATIGTCCGRCETRRRTERFGCC